MPMACSPAGGNSNPTPLPKAANGVGNGEKVLVSCCIIATTHFISGPDPGYSRAQPKAGISVAQLRNCESSDAHIDLARG